jgi:hypothetical protein
VLYLDSDNIPLRDPTYLFDAGLYSGPGKPGVVFWPDLNKDHSEFPSGQSVDLVESLTVNSQKPYMETDWETLHSRRMEYRIWYVIYGLLGERIRRHGASAECSLGQILINKSGNDGLNLAALHVAAHMQEEHWFYFRLSEGDKDTFVSMSAGSGLQPTRCSFAHRRDMLSGLCRLHSRSRRDGFRVWVSMRNGTTGGFVESQCCKYVKSNLFACLANHPMVRRFRTISLSLSIPKNIRNHYLSMQIS